MCDVQMLEDENLSGIRVSNRHPRYHQAFSREFLLALQLFALLVTEALDFSLVFSFAELAILIVFLD